MVKSNFKEEERLAEEIRKFPCQCDKSNEEYEEKDSSGNVCYLGHFFIGSKQIFTLRLF